MTQHSASYTKSRRRYLQVYLPCSNDLLNLYAKGWNTPEGDVHFKKQREAADNKDEDTELVFHRLHLDIGRELRAVGAFVVDKPDAIRIHVLNLCLAPGAYTAAILEQYPGASICGITLPVESGGHKMLLPYGSEDPRLQIEFLDLTMLIHEFLDHRFKIPAHHPDAANFITSSLFCDQPFDLVLCDGQALRTHERAEYRESREPRRLLAAQLVFGMNRIQQGGTFVILLHKAEAWDTIRLLKSFCSFAQVRLFKPESAHRNRSTFYLVAKDVQPDSIEARRFVNQWQEAWIEATFGGEQGIGVDPAAPDDADVDAVLQEFGPALAHLAHLVWSIQTNALSHSRWMHGAGSSKKPRPLPLQSTAVSGNVGPLTPRRPNSGWRMRLGSFSSSSQPSSVYSPRSPDSQTPSSPLTPRSGNQSKYAPRHEIDEDKQKKMAGRWR